MLCVAIVCARGLCVPPRGIRRVAFNDSGAPRVKHQTHTNLIGYDVNVENSIIGSLLKELGIAFKLCAPIICSNHQPHEFYRAHNCSVTH